VIKLIIFDLWSTLQYKKYRVGNLFWIKDHILEKFSYRKIMKAFEHNFQLDHSEDLAAIAKKMFNELKIPYNNFIIKKLVLSRTKLESKGQVYSHTIPLLKKLKKKGYKIALLSNVTHFHAKRFLKSKISKYIDKPFFSSDLGSIKPDPRNFKRVLKYFKVKPSEAIMIGDNYLDDIIPSRKLGLHTIHFKNGDQLNKELKKKGVL